jgi:hypothetical protein
MRLLLRMAHVRALVDEDMMTTHDEVPLAPKPT